MSWQNSEETHNPIEGVVEPNRPGHFLLSRLQKTPDDPILAGAEAEINERRAWLEQCYQQIETVGSELLRRFAETYVKHGLQIKGELRFYVIGGRLTDKPLHYDSDIDCAITVAGSGEDLSPRYGEEATELTSKKTEARREFANDVLSELASKFEFEMSEELPTGEVVKGSLIEPKEYGTSDETFRNKGLPAVLVTKFRLPPQEAERVAK